MPKAKMSIADHYRRPGKTFARVAREAGAQFGDTEGELRMGRRLVRILRILRTKEERSLKRLLFPVVLVLVFGPGLLVLTMMLAFGLPGEYAALSCVSLMIAVLFGIVVNNFPGWRTRSFRLLSLGLYPLISVLASSVMFWASSWDPSLPTSICLLPVLTNVYIAVAIVYSVFILGSIQSMLLSRVFQLSHWLRTSMLRAIAEDLLLLTREAEFTLDKMIEIKWYLTVSKLLLLPEVDEPTTSLKYGASYHKSCRGSRMAGECAMELEHRGRKSGTTIQRFASSILMYIDTWDYESFPQTPAKSLLQRVWFILYAVGIAALPVVGLGVLQATPYALEAETLKIVTPSILGWVLFWLVKLLWARMFGQGDGGSDLGRVFDLLRVGSSKGS